MGPFLLTSTFLLLSRPPHDLLLSNTHSPFSGLTTKFCSGGSTRCSPSGNKRKLPFAREHSSLNAEFLGDVPVEPQTSLSSYFENADLLGSISTSSLITQILVGTIAFVFTVIYEDRPQGELAKTIDNDVASCIEVKPSAVEGAGMGLFVKRRMTEGTHLGLYPGVIRPAQRYVKGKLRRCPDSSTYIWRFTDNAKVIDPTNRGGDLDNMCRFYLETYGETQEENTASALASLADTIGGFLCPSVPTELARINEPPVGGDTNVIATEDTNRRRVIFTLSRDVLPGEELYLDYGLTYDRTAYRKTADKEN